VTRRLVVKVGSSSVTADDGLPNTGLLVALAAELEALRAVGWEAVVVSSGAVAAGWATIGEGRDRPTDVTVLQAVSAVGQHRLMSTWASAFEAQGRTVGQVLLAPHDFTDRRQYLHARGTLNTLLELGVVPIVNENDAVADDEIRFGDNDRLAALVSQLVGAERLVMLTDAPGLLTADPRLDEEASLIEIVTEVDATLEAAAGGTRGVGSGGMASKLAAARIASFSGVEVVIADARLDGVLGRIDAEPRSVGTTFVPRQHDLSARRLWIAFAVAASGHLTVDAGAHEALVGRGGSLLAAGVTAVSGGFLAGDAVEIHDDAGGLLGKGLARCSAEELAAGSGNLVVVHRDDLVLLG
jgi:glutamate 5-kinase